MVSTLGSSNLLMLSRFRSINDVRYAYRVVGTDWALIKNCLALSGLLGDQKPTVWAVWEADLDAPSLQCLPNYHDQLIATSLLQTRSYSHIKLLRAEMIIPRYRCYRELTYQIFQNTPKPNLNRNPQTYFPYQSNREDKCKHLTRWKSVYTCLGSEIIQADNLFFVQSFYYPHLSAIIKGKSSVLDYFVTRSVSDRGRYGMSQYTTA